MSTAIHGILVALGTPEDGQPRALVHCTEEQIRSVETAAMMRPVVIVSEEEWVAMGAKRRRDSLALQAINRIVADQTAALTKDREDVARFTAFLQMLQTDFASRLHNGEGGFGGGVVYDRFESFTAAIDAARKP